MRIARVHIAVSSCVVGQYDSLFSAIRIVNNVSSVCNGNINSHGNIVNSINAMRVETRNSRYVFKKLSAM